MGMAEAREILAWDVASMLAYVVRRMLSDKAKLEDMNPYAESRVTPKRSNGVGAKLRTLKNILPRYGESASNQSRR